SSCCSTSNPCSPTSPPLPAAACIPTRSASGAPAGPKAASPWPTRPAGGASRPFPPLDRAVVKAMACEVVARTESPLSRQSLEDLAKAASGELGKPISRKTVNRLPDTDTIKPWRYEHWIFPRAADFFPKAARVLDLYENKWQDERLDPFDRIISADEKT